MVVVTTKPGRFVRFESELVEEGVWKIVDLIDYSDSRYRTSAVEEQLLPDCNPAQNETRKK